jgi:hypothetical protein
MVLYPDWAERAVRWLTKHWGQDCPCPFCETVVWNIGQTLIESRQCGDAGVMPMLQVVCDNCGHAVSVDASVAGLIEPGGH